MRCDQTGRLGLCREVGVEPEHDVGLGVLSFQLETREQSRAVLERHPGKIAAAVRLEILFERRARSPFAGEGIVGVDGQYRFGLPPGGDACRQGRNQYRRHQQTLAPNHFTASTGGPEVG